MALNENSSLSAKTSLYRNLTEDERNQAVLEAFEASLDQAEFAVYEVRRVYLAGRTPECRMLHGRSCRSPRWWCRHERTPLGTDGVCKRLGRKNLPATVADTLPPPLNSGRKTRIWDAEQLDAHLAGLGIPELPQTESPDGLVGQAESRLLLQNDIKETTWAAYIAKGFAPKLDGDCKTIGVTPDQGRCIDDQRQRDRGRVRQGR
ncbi:hypothetical protein [Streptomyces sp. NPDC017260]|uniref:hypothetical protein n=1 Tax=unclassified Streptomyces TaxID=2593676 RepID=UPI0037B613A5